MADNNNNSIDISKEAPGKAVKVFDGFWVVATSHKATDTTVGMLGTDDQVVRTRSVVDEAHFVLVVPDDQVAEAVQSLSISETIDDLHVDVAYEKRLAAIVDNAHVAKDL